MNRQDPLYQGDEAINAMNEVIGDLQKLGWITGGSATRYYYKGKRIPDDATLTILALRIGDLRGELPPEVTTEIIYRVTSTKKAHPGSARIDCIVCPATENEPAIVVYEIWQVTPYIPLPVAQITPPNTDLLQLARFAPHTTQELNVMLDWIGLIAPDFTTEADIELDTESLADSRRPFHDQGAVVDTKNNSYWEQGQHTDLISPTGQGKTFTDES